MATPGGAINYTRGFSQPGSILHEGAFFPEVGAPWPDPRRYPSRIPNHCIQEEASPDAAPSVRTYQPVFTQDERQSLPLPCLQSVKDVLLDGASAERSIQCSLEMSEIISCKTGKALEPLRSKAKKAKYSEAAKEAERMGRLDQCCEILHQGLKQHPLWPEAMIKLIILEEKRGNHKKVFEIGASAQMMFKTTPGYLYQDRLTSTKI